MASCAETLRSRARSSESISQKDLKDQRVKPAGDWNIHEIIYMFINIDLGKRHSDLRRQDCEVPKRYVGPEADGYRTSPAM